MVLVLLRMALM